MLAAEMGFEGCINSLRMSTEIDTAQLQLHFSLSLVTMKLVHHKVSISRLAEWISSYALPA
jgi:hypothetical protein